MMYAANFPIVVDGNYVEDEMGAVHLPFLFSVDNLAVIEGAFGNCDGLCS